MWTPHPIPQPSASGVVSGLVAAVLASAILLSGCDKDADHEATPTPSPVEQPGSTTGNRNDDGVGELVKTGKALYSQKREELIIRDYFQDRRSGVFLDVGCGHFARYSTTYYLEKHLGWSGIGVDALDDYAEGYRVERPRTIFANYLVTDAERGKQTFYRADALPEVSSVSREVAETQAERYRGSKQVTELKVPSITLNGLLELHDIETIDFLSMDIEEHEPAALKGFDIDRYKPELVCIEAHESVREPILAYFATHNYERLDRYLSYDRVNWYFAPKK